MTGAAIVTLPRTTNTISEIVTSLFGRPSVARLAAAATESIRFFGLTPARRTPSANALPGFIASIPAIHFGIGGVSPGFGRPRQLRAASSRKRTPRTILPHAMLSEVLLLVDASPPSAAR